MRDRVVRPRIATVHGYRLAGERPQSVRPLDLYGVPKSDSLALSADGSVRIDGRFQTYYYEVRR